MLRHLPNQMNEHVSHTALLFFKRLNGAIEFLLPSPSFKYYFSSVITSYSHFCGPPCGIRLTHMAGFNLICLHMFVFLPHLVWNRLITQFFNSLQVPHIKRMYSCLIS